MPPNTVQFPIPPDLTPEDLLAKLQGLEDLGLELISLVNSDSSEIPTNIATGVSLPPGVQAPKLQMRILPDFLAGIDQLPGDCLTVVSYAGLHVRDGEQVTAKPVLLYRQDPQATPAPGYVTLKGKISTFGGPSDSGVGDDEGLALINSRNFPAFSDYFLPGTTAPLAKRLANKQMYYLACRWDYKLTPPGFLVRQKVTVSYNGISIQAQPIDWGPGITSRVADLSDKLAEDLGVETDRQEVTIRVPKISADGSTQAGPVVPGPQQSRYDQRTDRNIATLQSDFAVRVSRWLNACRAQGLNPLVHFGSRTAAEQQALYQKYRSGGPKAVPPRLSYHCYGRAFDWVNIRDPNADDRGLEWNNDAVYAKGTQIARQFEIRGIGSIDNDHLQDARFSSYTELANSDFDTFPTSPA